MEGLLKLNYWDREEVKEGNHGIYLNNKKVVEVRSLLLSRYGRKEVNFYPEQQYKNYLIDTEVISQPTELRKENRNGAIMPCFSLFSSTKQGLEKLAEILGLPFYDRSIISQENYFP